jgi:hypothetical protein
MDRDKEEQDTNSDHGASYYTIAKPLATAEEFASILPHHVPRAILADTGEFLRKAGRRGIEGVVLWIGRRLEGRFTVERMVIPEQIASRWYFEVPLEERIRIAMSLAEEEAVALQVHTHERMAFHSPTDDRKAIIDRRWALSVVVPNFCRDGLVDLQGTTVFALRGQLDWVELTPEQINKIFIYS